MFSFHPKGVRALLGAAAAVTLVGVAGCSSGQTAETSLEYAQRYNGVVANVGGMALRAIYIVPQQGDTLGSGAGGYLHVVIVNDSGQADALTGITSANGQVTLSGASSASSAPSPGSRPSLLAGQTTPTAAASVASASATPQHATLPPSPAPLSPSAGTSATSGGGASLTIPDNGTITLDAPGTAGANGSAQVSGVNGTVRSGQSLLLTFSFAQAGSVSVLVPVQQPYGTTLPATPIPTATSPTPGPPVATSISPSPYISGATYSHKP